MQLALLSYWWMHNLLLASQVGHWLLAMYGCKFWQPGHIPSFPVAVEYFSWLVCVDCAVSCHRHPFLGSFSVIAWIGCYCSLTRGFPSVTPTPSISRLVDLFLDSLSWVNYATCYFTWTTLDPALEAFMLLTSLLHKSLVYCYPYSSTLSFCHRL
jgi:hypothetical protein